jgi:hypothetical protein
MAENGKRFVVKRLNWAEQYDGRRVRQPGGLAMASFATLDEAEAERARREAEAREHINPFACGEAVQYWTHLDEPRLRDWLMDHGVEPPAPGKKGGTNWAAWWKKNQKKLSADQRAAVWEALDKVRFFAVGEEPARPVGFAVVELNWEYNDEFYYTDAEGGRLVTVYRSRQRAEEECARQNSAARRKWAFADEYLDEADVEEFDPDDGFVMFDMQDRLRRRRGLAERDKLKKGEGMFPSTAGVPFFEVIEVELEGLA